MTCCTLFRLDQDQEVASKMATIEDLHNRLKLNIENIQQLNSQVTHNMPHKYCIVDKFGEVNLCFIGG